MVLIDKNSQTHLYLQIADDIRRKITSGEFAVDSVLPIESELCTMYNVSRYPIRQAMSILVKEGYLVRSRGKGTFVTDPQKRSHSAKAPNERCQSIAILLPGITDDFGLDILKGFEKSANEHGYATFFSICDTQELEITCIERMVRCGATGIVIFPVNNTLISEEMLNELISDGIYISIIDRNPGIDHIDYVGSDNSGGGYLAARHMKVQGYKSAVFVSDLSYLSSVQERLNGFQRGIKQYNLQFLNDVLQDDTVKLPDYSVDHFAKMLDRYKDYLPFAVLAENFYTASKVMNIVQEHGLTVGEDVGLVGFDNIPQSKYIVPPLTTIAQNGLLIGETAATLAIQKIESGSKQSVRHILPTQLIARKSCGEDRTRQ